MAAPSGALLGALLLASAAPAMAQGGAAPESATRLIYGDGARAPAIVVDPETGRLAYRCIDRMLAFAAAKKANVRPGPDLAREQSLFAGVGPA